MTPRERVQRTLSFEAPDVVPVEYHPSPAGMYEHGEKLRGPMCTHGHDFGDPSDFPLAKPDPKWVDAQGRYCEHRRDEWGTLWEHLIFGIAGHPIERPLDDWSQWQTWRRPEPSSCQNARFADDQAAARRHRERFFLKSCWISIFEVMHAVRRFEDVLMDIEMDTPEIHNLADAVVDHQEQQVRYHIARGVDGLQFADDFGTQSGLMISADTWRRFFRPRYERLLRPLKESGVKAFYHSCGIVWDLLDELAELGFDAIWPQVALYDVEALARRCRGLHLAVAIHPDRSHLMTHGSPQDVRNAVRQLAETFRVDEGGSWFYVEIDNGFPMDNVEALLGAIADMR